MLIMHDPRKMEVRGQNESLQKSTIVGYFALLSIYNIILLRLAMAIAIRLLSSDIIILFSRFDVANARFILYDF